MFDKVLNTPVQPVKHSVQKERQFKFSLKIMFCKTESMSQVNGTKGIKSGEHGFNACQKLRVVAKCFHFQLQF